MMTEYEKGLIQNLDALGCKGLALKLRTVLDTNHVVAENLAKVLADTSSEEVLRIKQEKAERLLKHAGLFNTYANLDLIEYLPERNLDKILIQRLSSCDFITNKANVIIVGAAGTGKTFLAKAIAVNACNNGIRSRVFHLRAILRELVELEKNDRYLYERRLRFLSRVPLLVIDEWFSITPSKSELVILHELIDARYDRTSTIICTQMPIDKWASFSGNTAIGEAITGRLTAHCFKLLLEGPDIRARHYERP